MKYSTFSPLGNNALEEPMFFGNPVNVARYDQQRYPIFETLTDKQLSFFWRPEEIDVTQDRIDYNNLPDHEQHIFISNLKYQILLDSIQGRSPSIAFLPIVSLPELETWTQIWSMSESIHSRSYTHIIRNIVNDPGVIFDSIVPNEEIGKRARDISKHYDDLIAMNLEYSQGRIVTDEQKFEHRRRLYLCTVSVNVLEAIRFYVSFGCSFAFAERKLMEGNAKIIKLIARKHHCGLQ